MTAVAIASAVVAAYALGVWATRQKYVPCVDVAHRALCCAAHELGDGQTKAIVADAIQFIRINA